MKGVTLSCRHVRRLVQTFLDGELATEQANAVHAHLDRCQECGIEAETLAQVRAAIAGLRSAAVDTAAQGATRRIMTKVKAQQG